MPPRHSYSFAKLGFGATRSIVSDPDTPNFCPLPLAGVAIVERCGPEMLRMLQGHTFGHNRNKFKKESDRLIAQTFEWDYPKQMQLI